MNRRFIAIAACFACAAIVALFLLAGRNRHRQSGQTTEPVWKVVVTLPKTNAGPASPQPPPKAR